MFKATTRKQTPVTFKPCLEALEERCLLDANPQVQLAADWGKLTFDFTRASIDAAVFADEVAIASGEGTPAGIGALAALAPVMDSPAMVSDAFKLVTDLKEKNYVGVGGDLLSLAGDTVLALAGDLIALSQDGMALNKDLMSFSLPDFTSLFSQLTSLFAQPTSPSNIHIDSFVVSPPNPAAGQSVTATATISGAPANTSVTLSVEGTDGYTDSKTVAISGSGSISLDIPGGAAGVTDTITLSVPGLPTQEDQFTYS